MHRAARQQLEGAGLDRAAQMFFVAPFSKEQTGLYVEKFATSKELNMDHWSAAPRCWPALK